MGGAALSLALIHPSAWSSTLAIRVRSKPHRLVFPRRPAGLLDFYHLASLRQSVKSRANQQLLSHQRQSVSEGRTPLMVPSRLPKSTRCPHHPPMGEQGDHPEQPQQSRGGSSDRQLRPLPLGLESQVPARLLEGHLKLPAHNKPTYYPCNTKNTPIGGCAEPHEAATLPCVENLATGRVGA